MLSQKRLNESNNLISKFLIKSHTDKDENSLFVRFSEIINEFENLQNKISSLERAMKIKNSIK